LRIAPAKQEGSNVAEEKNGRSIVDAIDGWVAPTGGPQGQFVPQGEWTVRLWNDEPGQPALEAGRANRKNRSPGFPASQMNGSLADELASRFGLKPIWQAAGFGPRLLASAAGKFAGDAPDETIRMGRTNTMLYL